MRFPLRGRVSLADTRAYFPSREEAERFARQFDGERYRIDIEPQPRPGREVFQVHVRALPSASPSPDDLLRLVGTVSDRAREGLPAGGLTRRMGRSIGEALAAKEGMGPRERRDALARLGALLHQCNLGALGVVSVTPLVLRVRAPAGRASPDRSRRCEHVAGFIEGALGVLLGKPPEVREMDCVGLGNAYCTFACEL